MKAEAKLRVRVAIGAARACSKDARMVVDAKTRVRNAQQFVQTPECAAIADVCTALDRLSDAVEAMLEVAP